MNMYDEARIIGGVKLQGGFIMESGPFGYSGESIVACTAAGFAGVSTETLSLIDGRSPWWNIYRQGNNLYNCSKWSDISLDDWVEKEIPYAKSHGATVIVTIGHTADDMRAIVPRIDKSGADAIKACTYRADQIVEMVKEARKLSTLPVWAKISANWPNYLELALECVDAGAQALVAIDTIGPVAMLQPDGTGALGSEGSIGWMSGECIHAKALEVVKTIRAHTDIPIIGVGGIMDAEGVRRMYASGANMVGLCSAVLINGLEHIKTIKTELMCNPARPLLREKYSRDARISIDKEICTNCGECVKHCGYMALSLDTNGKLKTEDGKCRRCGLCQQFCEYNAITLTET